MRYGRLVSPAAAAAVRIGAVLGIGEDAGSPGDASDVEDERHPPVSSHGRAGEGAESLQLPPERLDDDLLRVSHFVDEQPELAPLGGQNDHRECPVRGAGHRAGPDLARQVHERQQRAAQPQHPGPLHVHDHVRLALGADAHEFHQARLGHGVAFALRGNDERGDDHQRQRHPDPADAAAPGRGGHLHRSPDSLHVGAHHVHAHAAAGDLRDGVGGREAGAKHELDRLPLREPLRLLGPDETDRHGLGSNLLQVHAGTVVLDLHDHLAPVVEGADGHRALRGLARREARVRALDPVVDGVSHHVRERVLDGLEQGLVELGFLSARDEPHLLPADVGGVAGHAGKAGEDVVDRLHPGLHHRLLQAGGELVDPNGSGREPCVLAARLLAEQLVAGEDQFADEGHESVKNRHGHPQRASPLPASACDSRARAGLAFSAGIPAGTAAAAVGTGAGSAAGGGRTSVGAGRCGWKMGSGTSTGAGAWGAPAPAGGAAGVARAFSLWTSAGYPSSPSAPV